MEIILVLLIYLGFGYALYKVAKSKNRDPIGWILISIIISPLIMLIILALMPTLPGKKNNARRRKK